MKHPLPHPPAVEPMVDARHAAGALNLPLYYFTKPASREARAIPFYRIGKTIRFRLSELEMWSERFHQHAQAEGGQ
ncbi:MAG: hypothetical protein Q8O33_07260 [Pseudomonadota bacterium]|nr:hypothetical protein [Pseudomonadota bacterium]